MMIRYNLESLLENFVLDCQNVLEDFTVDTTKHVDHYVNRVNLDWYLDRTIENEIKKFNDTPIFLTELDDGYIVSYDGCEYDYDTLEGVKQLAEEESINVLIYEGDEIPDLEWAVVDEYVMRKSKLKMTLSSGTDHMFDHITQKSAPDSDGLERLMYLIDLRRAIGRYNDLAFNHYVRDIVSSKIANIETITDETHEFFIVHHMGQKLEFDTIIGVEKYIKDNKLTACWLDE